MKTATTQQFPFIIRSGSMLVLAAGQIAPIALVHATGETAKGVPVESLSYATDGASVVVQTQDGGQTAYNGDDLEILAVRLLGERGYKVELATAEQG